MDRLARFPIWTFLASCASISSVAALSVQLAQGRPLELKALIGTAVWSSIAGTTIGAMLAPYLADEWLLLSTVGILAGIGAASLIELLFVGIRHCVTAIAPPSRWDKEDL